MIWMGAIPDLLADVHVLLVLAVFTYDLGHLQKPVLLEAPAWKHTSKK